MFVKIPLFKSINIEGSSKVAVAETIVKGNSMRCNKEVSSKFAKVEA